VADNGTGRLTVAVVQERWFLAWSPKTKVSGGKRRLFSFPLLEHDSCVLNWIRADFTPQIQKNGLINK
jgi:hypothetical protein